MLTEKRKSDGKCQSHRQYHQLKPDDQHYDRRHFLVLMCKRHFGGDDGHARRNGKSNDIAIWWQFGCLLAAQLLFATQTVAQTGVIYQQNDNVNDMPSPSTTPPLGADVRPLPLSGENFEENLIQQNKGRRQYLSSFSDMDKEVVERLIKQWAPVVWLAPEEKFMPLGVEEFLAHVHPESKGKPFIPGMPLGDNSEKSYLVTNAEIDQLLENETSFIYGRNPNVSPVPIYAVVTLCNMEQLIEQQPLPKLRTDNTLNRSPTVNIPEPAQPLKYPPHLSPGVQHSFQQPIEVTKSTRGPYIPITLGPQDQVNNTIRRSSRLYPVFQRVKRNVPPLNPKNIPPSNIPLGPFDLVMGESAPPSGNGEIPVIPQTTPSVDNDTNDNENINNFIANLADNVKFSIPINDDLLGNKNDLPNQGVAYKEGTPVPSFHVTYWMFYPYSQGKNMCTLSLGPFGRIPFPSVYGYCLGRKKDIGSHIGDWEHMTLYFTGTTEPEAMYVSAHDAGAFYTYNRLTGSFEFKRQETRKGILQRPNFPKTVTTFNDHPVLFAAKGSHGLWTAPGKHRFVKVARLYDINGFGTPWNTWKRVSITYENLKSYGRSLAPTWLSFKGKWGNPKSKCHPLRRIGLNFCEFTDGPTGIPLKEPHFQCGADYRR